MAVGRGQRGECRERETALHSLHSLLTGAYRGGGGKEGERDGEGERDREGKGESWEEVTVESYIYTLVR